MKIFSLSVYGNNPRYIVGAKRQIELAKEFYPDFRVRLYTDNVENYEFDSKVDLIDRRGYSNGVFWRFEPLFESEENIVIVRDSDGRITVREQMAVNEWLNSEQKFHTFRDHEAHYEFPVIACAFGYKGKLSSGLLGKMNEFVQNPFYYTNDQIYLKDHVFPQVKDSAIIHCMKEGWFSETRKKLKNKYDFCGNGYDEFDMPLYPPSLDECINFNPSQLSTFFKYSKGIIE